MKASFSNRRRAFTLLEIMVALMLFTIVVAAIFSTFSLIMRATKTGQDAAGQAQRQRIAIRTIEDALMCVQSFQASQKYYWFQVENGQQSALSFVARVPEVFPRNGKFGDLNQRRLTFTVEPDKEGGKNLVLRQNPVLMEMDEDEKAFPLILARNVKHFIVECWGTNKNGINMEWTEEWLNTNSIPKMVRVGLVMGGNTTTGRAAPEFSVSRAFAMPAEMMPAALQQGRVGAVGGRGGPGGGPTIVAPGGTGIPIQP